MKNTVKFGILITSILLNTMSASAEAHNCGKVNGHKIVTYGGLSCAEAKRVYKAFQAGHIPKNWNCGLSAGACDSGKKSFTFRFN